MSLNFNPYETKCLLCNSCIEYKQAITSQLLMCGCNLSWYDLIYKDIYIMININYAIRLHYSNNEVVLIHMYVQSKNYPRFIASNFTTENIYDKIIKLNNIS